MIVSIAEGNRRLLVLAEFLEKLPPKRFYYGRWVGENWKGRQDLSCGTTACALGWAATMRPFRKLGLVLKRSGPTGGLVSLRGVDGFITPEESAADVFGITVGDARFLFLPNYAGLSARVGPKKVAAHIRKFVAGRATK